MPNMDIPKNYQDGIDLTEDQLDDAFEYIEGFLNSTKIDGDNIQAQGIPTAAIANSAVTEVKIAGSAVTTNKIADANVTEAKLASPVTVKLLPAGVVSAYAGATPPTGWLLCDGSSKLRADYPDLFTAIGTTWGAADGTHFNVPNFINRFLRGAGAATDGNGGDTVALGAFQDDAYESHNHGGNTGATAALSEVRTVQPGDSNFVGISAQDIAISYSAGVPGIFTANHTHTISSGGSNENRPKSYGVNYIIKT